MDDTSASLNPPECDITAGDAALVLPVELTIYTVGELHPKWNLWATAVAAHSAAQPAHIEAQQVGEVDAAGLQLLLSLQRALSASGRAVCISDPSGALSKACAGLGLSDWLKAHSQEATQ